jgi:rod shape determining protein RodA
MASLSSSRSDRRELKIDWLIVGLYLLFVFFGWVNIYAASTTSLGGVPMWDMGYSFGKQFFWIWVSLGVSATILMLDTKLIEFSSYLAYGLTILLLLAVLAFGREVNGNQAWIDLGFFRLQPSEFAKVGVALALARYMTHYGYSLQKRQHFVVTLVIIALPMGLTLLQGDTGTALVFPSLIFMLYREGLSAWYLILGFLALTFAVLALLYNQWILIGVIAGLSLLSWWLLFGRKQLALHILLGTAFSVLVLSVDLIYDHVMQPHQQHRIKALFDPSTDPLGTGWNITQSKIAIGSGGMWGKGFLEGTQTKFDFVPMQDTDFIFCTIGEEYGWFGTTAVIVLFVIFLAQLSYIAESSRSKFARVYTYSVVSYFFMHLAINIGMTIGLTPVIGIPLPFFSYGGSSLLAFSSMVAISLNFYANRSRYLAS